MQNGFPLESTIDALLVEGQQLDTFGLALPQQLQAARKAERKEAMKEPAKPVERNKSNNLPERHKANGFVFSNTAADSLGPGNHPENQPGEHIAQAA